MKDSSDEILERWQNSIDRLTPEARLKMACSMFNFSRTIVEESIRAESPNISESELAKKTFLRFYESDLETDTCQKIIETIWPHKG